MLVLLVAGIEEGRVVDALFFAHCMEIALPSIFELYDIEWSSFIEVLEEGVVSSWLELELVEVVILIVEHMWPSLLLVSPHIYSPLGQAIQLFRISQSLQ